MPYGTIAADTLQSSTANTAPVFYDGTSREIGRLCKGYVTFNTANPPTTTSSFNVSSMTYVSSSDYTVGFTTSYSSTGYNVGSCSGSPGSASSSVNVLTPYTGSLALRLGYWYSSSWYSLSPTNYNYVSIFT